MSKNYYKYLQFLATKYNILYIGKGSKKIYDDVSAYFLSSSKIDINEEILTKIENILTKRHINIVVIDVEDNNPLAVNFYNAIKAFDNEILTMLLFDPKEYKKLVEVLPKVDIIVSYPIDKSTFHKKLFTILSRFYALDSIGRRDIILKQASVTEEPIEKFFDTYEGSALFIADDLMEMVNELNAGNLTHPFFVHISQKITDVADIFSKAEQTKSVTPVYEELACYLKELELETIQPENLKGFTYLSEILSDVSVYLMDMFVDRIFKDVYVFEYSLKDNIEFMKNTLLGTTQENDESEIDFF